MLQILKENDTLQEILHFIWKRIAKMYCNMLYFVVDYLPTTYWLCFR